MISSHVEDKGLPLLEKAFLELGNTDRRIALIKKFAPMIGVNKRPYFSIGVKDKAGKTVYGCWFNIELSPQIQKYVEALIDRPCFITYKVSEFMGDLRLDITNIEELEPTQAFKLDQLYFKSSYPEDKFETAKRFIEGQLSKLEDEALRNFIDSRCKMSELRACSDLQVYDGMLGASISVISSNLVALNGIFSSQPGYLKNDDKEVLTALIVYLEVLIARHKPMYSFFQKNWYTEMLDSIRRDASLTVGDQQKSSELSELFEKATEAVWSLAGVEVQLSTVTQLFLYLRKGTMLCSSIIETTNGLPKNVSVNYKNRSYRR